MTNKPPKVPTTSRNREKKVNPDASPRTVRVGEELSEFIAQIASHRAPLLAFALRIAEGNEALANDLVQQTMEKAIKAADFSEKIGTGELLSYLYKILQNQYIDIIRRSASKKEMSTENDSILNAMPDESPDQETEIHYRQIFTEVNKAISQLNPILRIILEESFLSKKSDAEIAKEQNISAAAVRTRLHRARRILVKYLKEKGISIEDIFGDNS